MTGRLIHALLAEQALTYLDATAAGLDSTEADRRRARCGPNRPPQPPRRHYVLLGAAAVTALLAHWVETGAILAVVINAIIGHIQEGQAEQAMPAIRDMLAPHASVPRDGHHQTIDATEPVPVDKGTTPCIQDAAIGDRSPML
ncbi:MAG: hypothetical protein Kow0073_16980 [Immundisolibacter sp.]